MSDDTITVHIKGRHISIRDLRNDKDLIDQMSADEMVAVIGIEHAGGFDGAIEEIDRTIAKQKRELDKYVRCMDDLKKAIRGMKGDS